MSQTKEAREDKLRTTEERGEKVGTEEGEKRRRGRPSIADLRKRERANSIEIGELRARRKREREVITEGESKEVQRCQSTEIIESPPKKKSKERGGEMEGVLRELKEMREEIRAGRKEFADRMKGLEEAWKEKEDRMERRLEQMEARLEVLERKEKEKEKEGTKRGEVKGEGGEIEKQTWIEVGKIKRELDMKEKRERKNNIVIKGRTWGKEEEVKKKAITFIGTVHLDVHAN